MNVLKTLYKSSLSLLTDLYQLTMAYGYWKSDLAQHEAVFHLCTRDHPFKGGYTICAGLATVVEFISQLHFTDDDLAYLAALKSTDHSPLFEPAFLEYLKQLHFDIDLDAIEEGRVIFPHEPLIRVKGSLLKCQLLETALLNIINFQTLIATKASRICYAAKGDPILEFGLRRAQGFDGGLSASRAAFLGGCAATSNVLAGKLYDIPVRGTHAHSWIMVFNTEPEAFQTYAQVLPHNSVFLVDTYNTLEGVKNAIQVGKQLDTFSGIRLDSGDLAQLSIQARALLDAAGFQKAMIVGSGDLDEYLITDLKAKGAAINVWGVGTKLCTAYDQPALHISYKLSAIRAPGEQWQYKMKLSEQKNKMSTPGILQVKRFLKDGKPDHDIIYDEALDFQKNDAVAEDLLVPIFRQGALVYEIPTLSESRERCQQELSRFPESIHNFSAPFQYHVELEDQLNTLKIQLAQKIGHCVAI